MTDENVKHETTPQAVKIQDQGGTESISWALRPEPSKPPAVVVKRTPSLKFVVSEFLIQDSKCEDAIAWIKSQSGKIVEVYDKPPVGFVLQSIENTAVEWAAEALSAQEEVARLKVERDAALATVETVKRANADLRHESQRVQKVLDENLKHREKLAADLLAAKKRAQDYLDNAQTVMIERDALLKQVHSDEAGKSIQRLRTELEIERKNHENTKFILREQIATLENANACLVRERDGYFTELCKIKEHVKTLAPVGVDQVALVELAARDPRSALLVATGKAILRELPKAKKPQSLAAILAEQDRLRELAHWEETIADRLEVAIKQRDELEAENKSLKASAERMRVLGTTVASKDAEIGRKDAEITKLRDNIDKLEEENLGLARKLLLSVGDERPRSEGQDVKALDVLEEATRLVDGARQASYGPPADSFNAIARLWTEYLMSRDLFAYEKAGLSPRDVCMLMILMKVARDAGGEPKRDNLVDIAGYVRCAELLRESEGDQECTDEDDHRCSHPSCDDPDCTK